MHRHESLRPFSRGHQPLLVHARDLRWRAEYLKRGDEHLGAEAWQRLCSWSQFALEAHLTAEEQHLLPVLRQHATPELVAALDDDAAARAALREAVAATPSGESPAALRALCDALRGHAWHCERTLFPLAERLLTDDQLAAIATAVGVYEI